MAGAIVTLKGAQMHGRRETQTERCTGSGCEDYERPIVILAQGVSYHYDGDKEKAREEAWKKSEAK